jgi:hypothetical protein
MKFLGTYNRKDNSYTKVKKLSNEENERYKKAAKRIYSINEDLSLLEAVRVNHKAYLDLLKHYVTIHMSTQDIDGVEIDQMVGNINLHLLNYLSIVKTFLAHSEFKLKRLYGKNSQRYLNFDNATSNAFDNCFSYRFLYHLRNYVQHCGMPIAGFDGLRFGHRDKLNKTVQVSLVAYCDRDELLDKYGKKWHKKLLNEIPYLQPRIDITPHINNMMKCIKKLSTIVIKDDLPELIKNAEFLEELIRYSIGDTKFLHELTPSSELENIPFICESDNLNNDIVYNIEWFPLHLMQVVFFANNNLN